MNSLRWGVGVFVAIFFVFFLVFYVNNNSGPNGKKNADTNMQKVRIGYLAIAGALPLFVADYNGYFDEVGIDAELIQFKSSNEIAIAAATNRIDVIGIGATNAVLDASMTSGIKFGAFLLNGYTKATETRKATDFLLARKGLKLEDLNGKKIAFFPGSISKVFAQLIFPKIGVDLDQIQYIEMSPPNWVAALESGVIDAVTAIEPFAQQMRDNGTADVLVDGYYAEVMPDVPLSAVWFVRGRLDPNVEKKVYMAFSKSLETIKTNRSGALRAFSKFTRIKPEIYGKIGLNRWRLIGEPGASESLDTFVKILVDSDTIKGTPPSYTWEANTN